MAQYMSEFLQTFGPVRNNHWLKSTPLNATMKIWMDNRDHLNPKTMINLFRRRLANDAAAIDLGRPTGMSAGKYARDKFLIMLNDGRIRDLFVDKDKENDDTISDLEDIDVENIREDE